MPENRLRPLRQQDFLDNDTGTQQVEVRTPVFPLFDGHIQLTHITKKYDQTLGSHKNRYTVVSVFRLLIKVTSYNNRVLTVDRQAKFTQDKRCWVKVNENMRNHLIKGLAMLP